MTKRKRNKVARNVRSTMMEKKKNNNNDKIKCILVVFFSTFSLSSVTIAIADAAKKSDRVYCDFSPRRRLF